MLNRSSPRPKFINRRTFSASLALTPWAAALISSAGKPIAMASTRAYG